MYVSWPRLSPLRGWGNLTMAFTGKFVYMAHHFIMLWLNPFGLRVEILRLLSTFFASFIDILSNVNLQNYIE